MFSDLQYRLPMWLPQGWRTGRWQKVWKSGMATKNVVGIICPLMVEIGLLNLPPASAIPDLLFFWKPRPLKIVKLSMLHIEISRHQIFSSCWLIISSCVIRFLALVLTRPQKCQIWLIKEVQWYYFDFFCTIDTNFDTIFQKVHLNLEIPSINIFDR